MTINAATLHRMITQTTPHVSDDDTLPVIHCLRLEADGGQLFAVASDRYTLAAARAQFDEAATWQAAIPFADIPAVTAWLAAQGSDSVSLQADSGNGTTTLALSTANGTLRIASTDSTYENFPNWRSILLKNLNTKTAAIPVTCFTSSFLARWQHAATRLLTWQNSPTGMLLVVDPGGTFIGAQMPVRQDEFTRNDLVGDWTLRLAQIAYVEGQSHRLDIPWEDKDGDRWEYSGRRRNGEPLMHIAEFGDDPHTLADVIDLFGPIRSASG
jgi:hypothetical protein